MAQKIQLGLWNGMGTETMPDPCEDIESVFFGKKFIDMCARCDLRDVCGADDCAKKGYEIDIDHDPAYDGTFEDWLSEPW